MNDPWTTDDMKTIIVPEPFSASSFSISVKEAPRSEEESVNGLKARKRRPRQRRRRACDSVPDVLLEAAHGQPGQERALRTLKKDCEAAGSSEPTEVLESSLVRQRLARRLQPSAFAPPADE